MLVLSFGYGYTLIAPETIERQFGIKTVLNSSSHNAVTQIDRSSVSGNLSKSKEQMPRQTSISEFGIDFERDLLERVTAYIPDDGLFKGNVCGSDSLSMTADVTLATLPSFLKECFKRYTSEKYKKEYPWFDHISPVGDPQLKKELEAEAVRLINEGDSRVWTAVPEIINWENISGFVIEGMAGELRQNIDIQEVKTSFRKGLTSFDQLKTHKVRAMDSTNDVARHVWTIDKCLYGEIPYNNEQYCVVNSHWYRLNGDYVKEVTARYESLPLSDIKFPDCLPEEHEDAYNVRLAESNDEYMLMDRKNISHGGGRSRIELCDVLSDNGEYIHVKNFSGSAALSHLFKQGLNSAKLVKSDEKFCNKANSLLNDEYPKHDFKVANDSLNEVIYAIITKEKVDRPRIPFFSKMSLLGCADELRLMGVSISIKSIYREKSRI